MNEELRKVMTRAFTNYIGRGSNEDHIIPFKDRFPEIIEKYDIKSVNDAGCGLSWVKDECDKLDVSYSGFDILKREGATVLDITTEVMPTADLIICRLVLLHLTDEMVDEALKNFAASGSKYLLASSDYNVWEKRPKDHKGRVIESFIDLIPRLGEPLEKIEEPIDDRFMGLWKLST